MLFDFLFLTTRNDKNYLRIRVRLEKVQQARRHPRRAFYGRRIILLAVTQGVTGFQFDLNSSKDTSGSNFY